MKNLELEIMLNTKGGNPDFVCAFAIGFGATIGFALGGPPGMALGAIGSASVACAEEAY